MTFWEMVEWLADGGMWFEGPIPVEDGVLWRIWELGAASQHLVTTGRSPHEAFAEATGRSPF